MIKNNPASSGVLNELIKLEQGFSFHPSIDYNVVRRLSSFVGNSIETYSVLARAMDRARNYIVEQDAKGVSVESGRVFLADSMTGSKGRFTRVWHAPDGGVWGCLLHANTLLPHARQFLSLAVGVACCETIRSYGVETASIRWVNDVLVGGRKLAGFLVESHISSLTDEEYNLIGFGINVNNSDFPKELSSIATSLSTCLGSEVALSEFSEKFIARLAWNVGLLYYEEETYLHEDHYSGAGGQHFILEKFLKLSDTIGKRVVYGFDVMTTPQYEAQVLGVDQYGGLVLQFDDATSTIEYSGEVRYIDSRI